MAIRRITAALLLGTFVGGASAASAQDRADWPSSFTLGAASQGGTYFVYGSGWASLVSNELGIPGGVEVTGGPVQNAALVQAGDLDMGMVTMGPAAEALAGESAIAPGLVHDKLRAIFPMYQTTFHVITLEGSGVTDIASIPDGASVGVGPEGGTPGTYWPRFFETLGKPISPQHSGAADLGGQLQDGLIEVYAWAAGIPFPTFSELDAQLDVGYFGFTDEEAEAIIAAHPVSPFTIPAGTYPSQTEDQTSVSMWNFAVASADLSEDFVYEVVKTVMTSHDRMMEIHQASVETLPENFDKNGIIPWHPGAVRWFEENGYDIPDELEG